MLGKKEIFNLAFNSYISECNIKNLNTDSGNNAFLPTLFLIVYPLMFYSDICASIHNAIQYFMYVIPLVISLLLLCMHSHNIPKQMHLCPMTRSEKMQYIRCHYIINLLVPLFIMMLFCVITLSFGIISLLQLAFSLVYFVLFCLSFSFHLGYTSEPTVWGPQRTQIDKLKTVEKVFEIIAMFTYIWHALLSVDHMNITAEIISLIIVVIIIAPMLGKLIKHYDDTLEYFLNFENTIKIEKSPKTSR